MPVRPDDRGVAAAQAALPPPAPDEVFHLFVLCSDDRSDSAEMLATFRNARILEKFGKRGGEAGARWQQIIRTQQRILNYLDGKPGARDLPRDRELIDFGAVLFETLFPGKVRRLYDVARAAQDGRRLDIVFTSMIDWIADKPWEFAYDPGRQAFLATEEVNFVRNVLTAVPADRLPPRSLPLRVLIAVAQPIGQGLLSADEEVTVIQRGFRRLITAGLVRIEVLRSATPALLHQCLDSGAFDILHFIGHGAYDEAAHAGYLLFEDARGAAQRVDARTLRQILCRRGIRLVFLNACETGSGGRADFNRGVAPALVAGGIPAVVANQYSVLDPSATAFARHFYWELARGRTLGDAAREARVAVNYSIAGEAIDWAVPVVYARHPAEVLCLPPATAAVEPPAPPRRRTRGADNRRSLRIGLWDINHVVPALEHLARSLNRSQKGCSFEVVDVSAPLGAWRLERRRDNGHQSFLHGEEVARRLGNVPLDLGLDRLFCITTFRLGGEKHRHVNVWDDDPHHRITIFSTAGRGVPRP